MTATIYTVSEEAGFLTQFVPDAELPTYRRTVAAADMVIVGSSLGRGGFYVTTTAKS